MQNLKNNGHSHFYVDNARLNIENKLVTPENTPILFQSKKKQILREPLQYIKNDTGYTRHFTPAAQEWHNSICSYNSTYYKWLPVNDRNLFSLLKSYFNGHKKIKNIAKAKVIKKDGKYKNLHSKKEESKPMPIRYRRLSTLRTFIGKGDLKHTSKKVILTFYVYNTEVLAWQAKLKKIIADWYCEPFKISLIKTPEKKVRLTARLDSYIVIETTDEKILGIETEGKLYRTSKKPYIETIDEELLETTKGKVIKIPNKKFITINDRVIKTSNKYLVLTPDGKIHKTSKKPLIELPGQMQVVYTPISIYNADIWEKNSLLSVYYGDYFAYLTWYVKKITSPSNIINKYSKFLANLVEMGYLNSKDVSLLIKEELLMFGAKCEKWIIPNFLDFFSFFTMKNQKLKKTFYKKFRKYFFLIYFNNRLYKEEFISRLIDKFIKRLYDKDVNFNIVNLKKMHLNSDIFTQAVSLKLRNRDNKLYRVLKASLRKIKVWPIDKIKERQKKFNKEDFPINKIRNNVISSMFIDKDVKDPLTKLLLGFYSDADDILRKEKYSLKTRSISLDKYILTSMLKHNKIRGVRIEAKGRLTRRFTASRSVFKLKWKGGLKNVDSSFRGLPAIMLRGYLKSNVQYSVINSKNRNGAYGVKGWVSSR